ncbi:putative chromatin regulator PHD family [Helianthus annuus]|nr:putative chromatin regulator PHD family [Helianthus annuus]
MLASNISDVINAAVNSPSPALACSSSVPCSICLDLVIDDGDRSIAKLHCGHKFHLDCIGSAFNTKGAMQCPNCRKVESGRWLFADGSAHAISESGARDWMPHEGAHDLSYSRWPIGLRWHPFGGFMVHSSFDFRETESALNTFAHFLGNYAMIAQHTATPSSARSYVSHFRPNEHVAGSNFHHPLNSHPAPRNNVHSTYIQHPSWGWNCHFLPYNADRDFIEHGNLTPVNPVTLRSTHARAQPVYYTQRLVSRTRESSGANSQSRERNPIHHAAYHHEQPSEVTNIPLSTYGFRRFGGALALPMILPAVPRQPHNHGVHGSYISETERDESSYIPVIHGSFHHHRS